MEERKERNFPNLELPNSESLVTNQPVLVIQSPKTPTLSKKFKAVSLDSDPPKQSTSLEVSRDVFSMPNTPKRQFKQKLSCELDDTVQKSTLTPNFSSNLKRFASNTSISGSQTLKTLPEIMTLHDFGENKSEPVRIKAKGLLERRGSNASLTIDLGSTSNISEVKPVRLNTAKSVSNLYLSSMSSERCSCAYKRCETQKIVNDRRKSQAHVEACGNCTIYEAVPSINNGCQSKCLVLHKKCSCLCNFKCRRKSLSNENLYVPPCNFCQSSASDECKSAYKQCKTNRKACYPRQPDLDASQLLSEDFKLHLQNIQYLQTAGSVLSIADLKQACESHRVPKLHQEFWEVPLNLQEKCLVSGSQSRNRYRGVLPNEHSRVHLPGPQTYIHANYIKGPDYTETAYIATQGPMSHTCEDFWEMVWHTKCNCIVMLTNLVEKGKSKCELYFPLGRKNTDAPSYFTVRTMKVADKFTFEARNTQQYEEVTVKFEEIDQVTYGKYRISYRGEETIGGCVLRRLYLERENEQGRTLYHYWFPNWQDHKMADPKEVLEIATRVLTLIDANNRDRPPHEPTRARKKTFSDLDAASHIRETQCRSPVVVHCSAGIGRTGCFLAILNGMQQLRSNRNVDVLAILCSLRLNRGGLVQTAEQYELVHRVLSLYCDGLPG